MKISEHEFEKGGNKLTRVNFSVGFEEIELLHAILLKASSFYPEITDEDRSRVARIKNMRRALTEYLGKAQPHKSRVSESPCPVCSRHLRGERAVASHVRKVHPDYKPI